MTDITEQELQSLRNLGNEYERAADEIEQLRAKLEWMPDGPDGIDCRDETIKMQDANDNAHRKAFAAIYQALRPTDPNRDTWPADIERMRAHIEIDASCPCCCGLRACLAVCTFADDAPSEHERMTAARAALYGEPT